MRDDANPLTDTNHWDLIPHPGEQVVGVGVGVVVGVGVGWSLGIVGSLHEQKTGSERSRRTSS